MLKFEVDWPWSNYERITFKGLLNFSFSKTKRDPKNPAKTQLQQSFKLSFCTQHPSQSWGGEDKAVKACGNILYNDYCHQSKKPCHNSFDCKDHKCYVNSFCVLSLVIKHGVTGLLPALRCMTALSLLMVKSSFLRYFSSTIPTSWQALNRFIVECL